MSDKERKTREEEIRPGQPLRPNPGYLERLGGYRDRKAQAKKERDQPKDR